jgi:hypothetical protein
MTSITPIPCRQVCSPEMVKRHVFCRHYDTCLDYAIQKNWQAFSCELCASFEREKRSILEWNEDHTRCAALVLYSIVDDMPVLEDLQVFEEAGSFAECPNS